MASELLIEVIFSRDKFIAKIQSSQLIDPKSGRRMKEEEPSTTRFLSVVEGQEWFDYASVGRSAVPERSRRAPTAASGRRKKEKERRKKEEVDPSV